MALLLRLCFLFLPSPQQWLFTLAVVASLNFQLNYPRGGILTGTSSSWTVSSCRESVSEAPAGHSSEQLLRALAGSAAPPRSLGLSSTSALPQVLVLVSVISQLLSFVPPTLRVESASRTYQLCVKLPPSNTKLLY